MRFRPCIDIHNGKVKQIVGGSLRDDGNCAIENFVAEKSAADFARFYHKDHLKGGHIILLNPAGSPYYEATRAEALEALHAEPGDFSLGGGVTPENAQDYLDAGASQRAGNALQGGRPHRHQGKRRSRQAGEICVSKLILGGYIMDEENWESLLKEVENMPKEELETVYDEIVADSPALFGDAEDYVFVPAKKDKRAS